MKKTNYPFTTGKELMQKEVINKYDGGKLGYVKNFGIDLCTGCLCSIILPPVCGGLFPKKEDEIVIPWGDIEKIGKDVILVRYYKETQCRCKGDDHP